MTRILLVTLFLVSTLILKIQAPVSIEEWVFPRLLLLLLAAYLFSLVSLVISWLNAKLTHSLAYFQIIWDLLFVTALLVVTGGISSPFSFLYLLSVINASVLLARREALYTASLCGILYGALLDFQFYGLLAPLGLSQSQASQYGAGYIFYTIFINIAGYYLAAFLTGYLAERALRSELALEEKSVDFDELTRLHSAIVTSMNSGLMTLDPDRKIKVFNACAELLTGFAQAEVYDRRLEEILPEFLPVIGALHVRAEITLASRRASPRILGCAATTLSDREGRDTGIIINFQDVTELKQMEAELKRADRLAAVGELSARIAHEIRNPLASISGSVQLIAQDCAIRGEERQLFDIVIKETERLNGLISEFLAYARPHPPQLVAVPLCRMIDDLKILMRSDKRFERITIRQEFAGSLLVRVDVDQFTQVFWNIFANAADAMPEGGEISVGMERLAGVGNESGGASWDEIAISDTGTGMSTHELASIFEPFFTTKRGGTGLGLATVYRIVEGHGGHVRVESTAGQGTRFLIYLPREDL
jgi:two-component system sensor histidine kinase PilS (NtrC family)